ncbi:hypothetical protein FGO68_gene2764 [Halteria grandinella]|uniref:Uncharacterized protein n=1 Tax=Halteria grandinella TaxID=5974 RepID=A0A8J8NMA1_HALGN|nr:hypothetical protein FGO68_gene2764 [Halteria grandinella]
MRKLAGIYGGKRVLGQRALICASADAQIRVGVSLAGVGRGRETLGGIRIFRQNSTEGNSPLPLCGSGNSKTASRVMICNSHIHIIALLRNQAGLFGLFFEAIGSVKCAGTLNIGQIQVSLTNSALFAFGDLSLEGLLCTIQTCEVSSLTATLPYSVIVTILTGDPSFHDLSTI